ncbi:Dicer-like protein 2 [Exophiala xenobiotica]|nr:Dicer-like protein 2 [Exophiala xenobiotica]
MASNPGGLQHSRAYQLEMFEQSMQRNIIVCMATGSGKTNVAQLRIDAELQRTPSRRTWFTAPNVLLAQQQHHVLSSQLPQYQMRTLLGHDNVHLWRTQKVWDLALADMNVIISTPQVLLDALRNAFVRLEDIALLVVDEAHHCHSGSPSAQIMLQHYHRLKSDQPQNVPHILGLTASIRISRKSATISELEYNLDAICRAPMLSVDDYTVYVHRAQILERSFTPTDQPRSTLFNTLQGAVDTTSMSDDPYYKALKRATDLASEQRLAKYEKRQATPAMKELKQLVGNAEELAKNVGSWASDNFIRSCVFNWHDAVMQKSRFDELIPKASLHFIDERLHDVRDAAQVRVPMTEAGTSEKALELIKLLATEYHDDIAIIIFVERRSTAYALCELLRSASALKHYKIFSFVGLATSRVGSLVEVADMRVQKKAFADFRQGSQDICVATSVAEEGIDIQAVNLVIRYDDPKQFVSFLQSRGRARQKDSKFVHFRNTGDDKNKYEEWRKFESELEAEYQDEMRILHQRKAADDLDELEGTGEEYVVESTGARLVYDNAQQHLQHFCTIVSRGVEPIYVLVGETNVSVKAKVVLPSCVPSQFQEASSKHAWLGEKSARKDAAFQAYKALHKAGLVTDHLVPFQPERVHHPQSKHGLRMHDIEGELPVWHGSRNGDLFLHRVMVAHDTEQYASMLVALPCKLEHTLRFQLCESHSRMLDVEVVPTDEFLQQKLEDAKRLTRTLFELVFHTGSASMSLDDASRIQLLVLPEAGPNYNAGFESANLRHFLQRNASHLNRQPLLVWSGRSPRPYIRHPSHQVDAVTPTTRVFSVTKVKKLQLYTSLQNEGEGLAISQTKSLDVDDCSVKGVASIYGPLLMLLPSILHIVSAALRAQHAEHHVLKDIGFSNTEHLVPALLAKSACGMLNYERLEFLGDTYLKYRASLQMYFDNPLAMEGCLTVMVMDLVSNLRLERAFRDAGLEPYITTRVSPRKHWKVPQLATHAPPMEQRKVISKTLGDVVESLLAAAFLEGSKIGRADPRGTAALRLFLPDVDWRDPADIVSIVTSAMPASQAGMHLVEHIERMTGYAFKRSSLLLEALTHATALPGFPSLERLEFLGDAIIDLIIKLKLFDISKLGPDRMTLHRHAIASHVYLAFCAFGLSDVQSKNIILDGRSESIDTHPEIEDVHLEHLIQFGTSQLRGTISAARDRHTATKDAIASQLAQGIFPWTLLRSINAPKVCSDVVESLIAGVFLDSGGSLDQCEKVLERLGVMDLLHLMISNGTFESATPATKLREACAAKRISVHISSAEPSDGAKHVWRVTLTKGEHSAEYVGRNVGCEEEARSIAAEAALEAVLAGEVEQKFQEMKEEDLVGTQDSVMTGMWSSSSEGNGGMTLHSEPGSI